MPLFPTVPLQVTAFRPAVWLAIRTLHPPPFQFGGLSRAHVSLVVATIPCIFFSSGHCQNPQGFCTTRAQRMPLSLPFARFFNCKPGRGWSEGCRHCTAQLADPVAPPFPLSELKTLWRMLVIWLDVAGKCPPPTLWAGRLLSQLPQAQLRLLSGLYLRVHAQRTLA